MPREQHTPGPWTVAFQRNEWVHIDTGEGFIADIQVRHGARPQGNDSFDHAIADARLISAAPDLYAALAELSDLCPRMNEDDPIGPAIRDAIMRGRAALKKADGHAA